MFFQRTKFTLKFFIFLRNVFEYQTLIIHRYTRYMPMVFVAIVYYTTLMKFTASSPFFCVFPPKLESCKHFGFLALVALENFMKPERKVIICSQQVKLLSLLLSLILVPGKWLVLQHGLTVFHNFAFVHILLSQVKEDRAGYNSDCCSFNFFSRNVLDH